MEVIQETADSIETCPSEKVETIEMSAMANLTQSGHKELAKAAKEFNDLLSVIHTDLDEKSKTLKEQKDMVSARHRFVKNYLECQLFMMARYRKRIRHFGSQVAARTSSLEAKAGELDENSDEVLTFIADLSKLKRRLKHILDVTDKFCVLTKEELLIKEQQLKKGQKPKANLARSLTTDAIEIADLDPADSPTLAKRSKSVLGSSFESNEDSMDEDVIDNGERKENDEDSIVDLTSSIDQKENDVFENNSSSALPKTPQGFHNQSFVKLTLTSLTNHFSVLASSYTKIRSNSRAASPMPTTPS